VHTLCSNFFTILQAVAAGDLKYVDILLAKSAELASTTSVLTIDLIKACNSDGFNMFHAAVIYKRMEMICMIIEHGEGRIHFWCAMLLDKVCFDLFCTC